MAEVDLHVHAGDRVVRDELDDLQLVGADAAVTVRAAVIAARVGRARVLSLRRVRAGVHARRAAVVAARVVARVVPAVARVEALHQEARVVVVAAPIGLALATVGLEDGHRRGSPVHGGDQRRPW